MNKKFDEQEVYERLYLKMVDYKRDYPFIDFLNDIVARRNKSFNKESAYNDLEKIFDAFMKYRNETQKYEQLENQIGCPLDVLFRALKDGVYAREDDSQFYKYEMQQVRGIGLNGLECICGSAPYPECDWTCYYKDYKQTWWLKEDRSE